MKKLDDGRIRCRVKIVGTYNGKPFEYIDPEDSEGSQFYWPPDKDNPEYEPSESWWSVGNMSCDCNRCEYVGVDLDCGHTIFIDRIKCIEDTDVILPPLILNESRNITSGST